MDCRLVFFDLRSADGAGEMPLMLRPLLFSPVLTWVCAELANRGVERFFIACDASWKNAAQAAIRDVKNAALWDGGDLPSGAAVLATPVLPLPEKSGPCGLLPFSTPQESDEAADRCRGQLAARLRRQGVCIIDPANTYVDPTCAVDAGVTLLPGAIVRGSTRIASGCEIGPNAMIRDSVIGENTTVNASQVNESRIGANTTVGPFAYVRPGTTVGDHCRVGDFVELKNSVIGDGTKISHLTYVGDSDVGQRVNFGCGTVTTNYDGVKKYRCTIGDDVFIGCNTNLIAPVTLGDGCYTAAGSTVTQDVPAGALAVARSRQSNKDGWAARFMAQKKKQ